MTFWVMQYHLHKCHLMPNGTINGTFHFLGQDSQNEVQHDFLGHMMPLVLASTSCDVEDIISHTNAFPRSR